MSLLQRPLPERQVLEVVQHRLDQRLVSTHSLTDVVAAVVEEPKVLRHIIRRAL